MSMDLNDENAHDEMETDFLPMSQMSSNVSSKTASAVAEAEFDNNPSAADEQNNDDLITDDESTKDGYSKEPVDFRVCAESDAKPAAASNTIRFHSKINPKKQIELFEVLAPKNVAVQQQQPVVAVVYTAPAAAVELDAKNEESPKFKNSTTVSSAAEDTSSDNSTNGDDSEDNGQPLKRRRSARLCRPKDEEVNATVVETTEVAIQPPVSEPTATVVSEPVQSTQSSQQSNSADLKGTIASLGEDIVEKMESSASTLSRKVEQESSAVVVDDAAAVLPSKKKIDKAKLKQNLIKRSKRLLVKQLSLGAAGDAKTRSKKISLVKYGSKGAAAANGGNTGQIMKNGKAADKRKIKSKLKSIVKNIKQLASNQLQQQQKQQLVETDEKAKLEEKPVVVVVAAASVDNLSPRKRRELEEQAAQEKRTLRRMNKSAKRMELIQQLNAEFSQSANVVDCGSSRKETANSDEEEKIEATTTVTTNTVVAEQSVEKVATSLPTVKQDESDKINNVEDDDEDDQPLSKLVKKRKLMRQPNG
jgi:hypothetical protein